MPQSASLITFRDKNADQIFGTFKSHSYFRHPKNVSYRAFLLVWIVLLAALFLIAKMRKRDIAEVASYATALIAIAILMMLANCVLAVFQPRYTLPMWELTIISVTMLFGAIMEYLVSPLPLCREADSKK
jgi:cytochrome bd-type quinol oxidase subunit 2